MHSLFSGTGTPACAPLLRRNPCDLGFRPKSHPVNARRQAEACPTKGPPDFTHARSRLHFPPISTHSASSTRARAAITRSQISPTQFSSRSSSLTMTLATPSAHRSRASPARCTCSPIPTPARRANAMLASSHCMTQARAICYRAPLRPPPRSPRLDPRRRLDALLPPPALTLFSSIGIPACAPSCYATKIANAWRASRQNRYHRTIVPLRCRGKIVDDGRFPSRCDGQSI